MSDIGALEYKSDLFRGFYFGGDVVLAQFAWVPSFKRARPSRIEHTGDRSYAALSNGVAVRLA